MTKTGVFKIAVAGIAGTTLMTLFSSAITQKKPKEFREHKLLSDLIRNWPLNKDQRLMLGWVAHYLVGTGFTMTNQVILKKIKTKPNLSNGILLGFINGVIGVLVWKALFELHPNPPSVHLKKYLTQLIVAHIIFGVISNITVRSLYFSRKRR